MAGSGSVIEEARNLIRERLDTLEDERKRLEGALKELGGKVKRSKPGPKPGSKPGSGKRGPRKRRGGSGGKETRLTQLLKFLDANPSASAKDAAQALGMSDGHVYGQISKAKKEGLLAKGDLGQWVVKLEAPASDDGGEKGSGADASKQAKPKRRKKAAAKKAAAKKSASDAKGKGAGAKDGDGDPGKSGDGEKGSGDSGSQTPAAASS